MKLGKLRIQNFGPYRELDFDFTNQGLALISGPTKSGKSTLMDAAAWIIYGITSKDSAADDVRSWFTTDSTEGSIEIYTANGYVKVFRTRGKSTENDLYWVEDTHTEEPIRGKDLKDTQRLLEDRIGVTAELYLIGSYMHQFSTADTFFIAKAKDRREVLEKLADLSLPIKLGTRASEVRKEKKKELDELAKEQAKLEGKLEQTVKTHSAAIVGWEKWETQKGTKLVELKDNYENFEVIRQNSVHIMVSKIEELSQIAADPNQILGRMDQIKIQIKALEQAKKEHLAASKKLAAAEADTTSAEKEYNKLEELKEAGACPTCTSPIKHNNHFISAIASANDRSVTLTNIRNSLSIQVQNLEKAISIENKIHAAYDKCRQDETVNERMIKEINELRAKIIVTKSETNRYHDSITELNSQENPYQSQIETCNNLIAELQDSIDKISQLIKETQDLIANLNWLYDKSFELRAAMLERAKNELTNRTNAYLEKFFDAELRITLSFDGADKLNVDIKNEGYPCPYKQLSGGERCMLKLAFNLSLMKRAEDVAGVKFGTIMLDEALNGLDANLKTKAFSLLQSLELEYDSILVIDHFDEFKNLFHNKYHVEKLNGHSGLTHE